MKIQYLAALAIAAVLIHFSCSFGIESREITTIVRVIDEEGSPVRGAKVVVSYSPFYETGDMTSGNGISDDFGVFEFTGTAYLKIFVSAEKDGYYLSRARDEAYVYDDSGNRVSNHPEIELTLKRIVNPVPMQAHQRLIVTIPEYNRPLGYDLFVIDWLPPHGIGQRADIVFQVSGYYNSNSDRDSTLVVRFPNSGDGLLSFEGEYDIGSILRSPQEAPRNGYVPNFSARKAVLDSGERSEGGAPKYDKFGYKTTPKHYVFRIRTKYNEQGEIEEAYYGKLYDSLSFDGVLDRESAVVLGSYYLNTKMNDRSLEFDIGNNLLGGLRTVNQPKRP